MSPEKMKITILYDNTSQDSRLTADFGFSCLVEAHGARVLFDTGAKADILARNMAALGIDPSTIDVVFVSHDHWDHTGGLAVAYESKNARMYVPDSCKSGFSGVIKVREPCRISEGLYSIGELSGIEQSLVVKMGAEVAVAVGCAHSGVREILAAAGKLGRVAVLVGELHGFDELDLLADLDVVCPTHCTRKIAEIALRYPGKYVAGGAGAVISWKGWTTM